MGFVGDRKTIVDLECAATIVGQTE